VDPAIVEDIANGKFNIYDLPKLHRDETYRNRYISKTVEGIVHPLSGGRPHIIQAKTKLHSSIKDLPTLMSVWPVYTAIRGTYVPQRAPGLSIFTSRLAYHSGLNYDFTVIINYLVAYFQKHQNSPPDSWHNLDTELHAEHFGLAAQKALLSNHPGKSPATLSQSTAQVLPIQEQVCRGFNRKEGCKIKERTGQRCLRLHLCSSCRSAAHSFPTCPSAPSAPSA
jgi:hypothetical protein